MPEIAPGSDYVSVDQSIFVLRFFEKSSKTSQEIKVEKTNVPIKVMHAKLTRTLILQNEMKSVMK